MDEAALRQAFSTVSGENARLMRLATYAAVGVALVLVAGKLVAWLATDSVSMLSTLVDSTLDAFASFANLIAVRHALVPADHEHRFGHGKAEALAGLGQSAFIIGSAAFLLLAAGQRLLHPRPLEQGTLGLAVMGVSLVLTIALVLFQRHVSRRTGSIAIAADSVHYVGDILGNLAVILAIVLSVMFGWLWADPLLGAAIAGFLLKSSWTIARQSLDILMDRELPDEDRRRIDELATAHPDVIEVHDLRTRSSGQQSFIQFHLVLAPDMTLRKAHRIGDEVEAAILEGYPEAEVLVHLDPEGFDEHVATAEVVETARASEEAGEGSRDDLDPDPARE